MIKIILIKYFIKLFQNTKKSYPIAKARNSIGGIFENTKFGKRLPVIIASDLYYVSFSNFQKNIVAYSPPL